MKQILDNPAIYPTLEILKNVMGENFKNYQSFLHIVETLALTMQWHYYKDTKSWLCKISHNKKTICWLSVWEDCFKTSFYFTAKHIQAIDELPITENTKQEFHSYPSTNKLLPIIINIINATMFKDVEILMNYKVNIKV